MPVGVPIALASGQKEIFTEKKLEFFGNYLTFDTSV